jgi:biopolymer transport protein ExbD
LHLQLVQLKRQDPDTSVVVHGDSAVLYQNMVNVLDVLQQANVTKVGLATERPAAANQSNL